MWNRAFYRQSTKLAQLIHLKSASLSHFLWSIQYKNVFIQLTENIFSVGKIRLNFSLWKPDCDRQISPRSNLFKNDFINITKFLVFKNKLIRAISFIMICTSSFQYQETAEADLGQLQHPRWSSLW